MYRTIRYDPTEICCRYLTIDRFENYIKQKFGKPTLPYRLNLPDFLNWFSHLGDHLIWSIDDLYDLPQLIYANSIEDLLHPIDRNVTQIEPGEKLYLPYWLGYIIVESINGYENIETFLLEEDGIKLFKKKAELVEEKYQRKNIVNAFNRVSFYKTAIHIIHCAIDSIDLTNGQIATFLIDYLEVSEDTLINDMDILLSFHWQWNNDFKRNKKFMYKKSLEVLEQDIWFLYEWLCSLHSGDGETIFIEKWSQDHTRCELGWTDIKKIVRYEEFFIEKKFITSVPTYQNILPKKTADLYEIFKQLSHYDSFWPWARSFHDMHKSLNTTGLVVYQQPRIIDYLIILTIRTEIVIRTIFADWCTEETPSDLKNLIKQASNSTSINDNEKRMLISIAGNDWQLTDLRTMPENIFQKIDDCETGLSWGKEVRFIFKQILKFVASRNYFAHNYYKDEDINYQRSLFAQSILSACIDSLLYFNKILK